MEEDVKAVQKASEAAAEIAKSTGKLIDATSAFGKWLDRILGSTIESAVGLASQELRYFQIHRAISLSEKVEARMAKSGITDIRTISPKIALPVLKNAAIEENETLHDLWANLLTSALNPENNVIERSFISILEDLSVADALTFQKVASAWDTGSFSSLPTDFPGVSTENFVLIKPNPDGIPSLSQRVPAINLSRLGLIRAAKSTVQINSVVSDPLRGNKASINKITMNVENNPDFAVLTPLGRLFWEAIQPI